MNRFFTATSRLWWLSLKVDFSFQTWCFLEYKYTIRTRNSPTFKLVNIGRENNIQKKVRSNIKMCWLNELVYNSQLNWFAWMFHLVTTYIYRPLTMSVYLMKSDVVGTSMSRAMMESDLMVSREKWISLMERLVFVNDLWCSICHWWINWCFYSI